MKAECPFCHAPLSVQSHLDPSTDQIVVQFQCPAVDHFSFSLFTGQTQRDLAKLTYRVVKKEAVLVLEKKSRVGSR